MAFHYIIRPNSPGATNPFSAGVDPQPVVTEEEYLSKVAADSGVARADVEKVIRAEHGANAAFAGDSRNVNTILGIYRILCSAGGSFPTATPDDSAVKGRLDYTTIIATPYKAAWRTGLTLVKGGQVGAAGPDIASVSLLPGEVPNTYPSPGLIEALGKHMIFDQITLPTARVLKPDGTDPIVCVVNEATELHALISLPAGVTGPRVLEYTTRPSGGPYTTRFGTVLAHA